MLKNKAGNVSHVKCSVCKQEKQINPTVRARRLEKFGSFEGIEASWICKSCTDKAMVSLGGNGIKVESKVVKTVKTKEDLKQAKEDYPHLAKGPKRGPNGQFLKKS
jgi:hypothetical protein